MEMNPGQQDGRQWKIHWAMTTPHVYLIMPSGHFCLQPMTEGPSNLLSSSFCSSFSGHFVNLLLGYISGVHFWGTFPGCTSGLNLAINLGPVQALFNGRTSNPWPLIVNQKCYHPELMVGADLGSFLFTQIPPGEKSCFYLHQLQRRSQTFVRNTFKILFLLFLRE